MALNLILEKVLIQSESIFLDRALCNCTHWLQISLNLWYKRISIDQLHHLSHIIQTFLSEANIPASLESLIKIGVLSLLSSPKLALILLRMEI